MSQAFAPRLEAAEPLTDWMPHSVKPAFSGWYDTRAVGALGVPLAEERCWWNASRAAWFESEQATVPLPEMRRWRGLAREVPPRAFIGPWMSPKCFACGRKLAGRRGFLIDTRDDQLEFVGPECVKNVQAAGPDGYQPPAGGPRLFLPQLADIARYASGAS